MDTSLPGMLALGFILGLRHALDPDHVAAVGALVSRHRRLAGSCLLGTFWGLGHTAALLAASIPVIAFKIAIPPEVERGLELAVALVLVLLGAHVLLRALGGASLHGHWHSHGGPPHRHLHLHLGGDAGEERGHAHLLRVGGRPFLVGLCHGLAGSAALMLLVVGAIPSALGGVLYVLVFGLGSTAGMLVLSGVIGLPFVLAASRSARAHTLFQLAAGAASLTLGLVIVWQLAGPS